MNIKMINDYVLVDLIENVKTTTSGIILTTTEPPCTGKVLSVGPGKIMNNGVLEDHDIKVGDVIVFGKASLNMPLEDDNKKFYVMKTGDIFGKKNG